MSSDFDSPDAGEFDAMIASEFDARGTDAIIPFTVRIVVIDESNYRSDVGIYFANYSLAQTKLPPNPQIHVLHWLHGSVEGSALVPDGQPFPVDVARKTPFSSFSLSLYLTALAQSLDGHELETLVLWTDSSGSMNGTSGEPYRTQFLAQVAADWPDAQIYNERFEHEFWLRIAARPETSGDSTPI